MKQIYNADGLEIFSSAYLPLDERMYLLLYGGEAMLVDPNEDTAAAKYLQAFGIRALRIVLTHSHYDHITGVNFFRDRFDCTVLGTALCVENLPDPRRNLSRYAGLVYNGHGLKRGEVPSVPRISCSGDIGFETEYSVLLGGLPVHLRAFPGHSPDSLMLQIWDRLLFTGDNLIPDTPTAMTLPRSDRDAWTTGVKRYLLGLSPSVMVFPGHGDAETLGTMLQRHPDCQNKTGERI